MPEAGDRSALSCYLSFPACLLCRCADTESLVALHVRLKEWDSAIQAAEGIASLLPTVYLPYASWLAEQGRFEEAQDAFRRANQPEQSLRLLGVRKQAWLLLPFERVALSREWLPIRWSRPVAVAVRAQDISRAILAEGCLCERG